jgi:hypothetical protein
MNTAETQITFEIENKYWQLRQPYICTTNAAAIAAANASAGFHRNRSVRAFTVGHRAAAPSSVKAWRGTRLDRGRHFNAQSALATFRRKNREPVPLD